MRQLWDDNYETIVDWDFDSEMRHMTVRPSSLPNDFIANYCVIFVIAVHTDTKTIGSERGNVFTS
jgi:hypothetical protein